MKSNESKGALNALESFIDKYKLPIILVLAVCLVILPFLMPNDYLMRVLIIIMLYIILLFRASRIASRCERSFPAFLILGLAMLIVVQAAVNMSVAVGLVPVTGQPLPLISRGGSSIMVTSIYFGMMISISRFARKRQDVASTDPAPAEATAESAPAESAPAADTSES